MKNHDHSDILTFLKLYYLWILCSFLTVIMPISYKTETIITQFEQKCKSSSSTKISYDIFYAFYHIKTSNIKHEEWPCMKLLGYFSVASYICRKCSSYIEFCLTRTLEVTDPNSLLPTRSPSSKNNFTGS